MVTPKRARGRPQTLPDPREFIPRLRAAGVPDAIIASTMGLSKQAIHARYGPRPDVPLLQVPPDPQPPRQTRQLAPENFPDRIRAWRTGRGLSQGQAAQIAGVDKSTWARWEAPQGSHPLARMVLAYLATLAKEP